MEIIRGQQIKPPRIVVYGEDKIGKSTLASEAGALFVQTEEGADEIGADRLPMSADVDHFKKAFAFALEQEHGAIAVDNLTGLEVLVQRFICKQHGVDSIEKVEKGYGKGYGIACEYWEREIIPLFDRARTSGKVLICIAHSQVRRAEAPDVEPFDQYGLDMHKSISALLRRWADVIGFIQREIKITETDVGFNKKVARGTGLDKRVLRVVGAPAYVAGNRYGLPASITLAKGKGWEAFIDAMTTRAEKASATAITKNGIQQMKEESAVSAEGRGE